MPLDKATIRNLNMQCRRALKKPLKFVYCPEGADGDPVLIIDKVVKPQLTELRKTAKQKKFIQGSIRKNGKVLALYPLQSPGKLKRDLTNTFGKKVTLLKTATVVLPSEEQSGESEEIKTLGNQIGRRAAKFRARPDKMPRGRMRKLIDQIDEYKSGGGSINYAVLRDELSQELKRRAAQREQESSETTTEVDSDVSPDVDTNTETATDSDTTSEDPTSNVDLNAMEARIGRLAARFRSDPSRPSMKQLGQLRDRIKEYVQAGGTVDFSLLRQELNDERKRRKSTASTSESTVSEEVIQTVQTQFTESKGRADTLLSTLTELTSSDAPDLDALKDNLEQLKKLREEIVAQHRELLNA